MAELEPLLYGYNYQVFLRLYRVPLASEASAEGYILQALGPAAVIGGVSSVNVKDMLAEVEESLRYVGDASHGPKPAALRSRNFKELVTSVLDGLDEMTKAATLLAQFWLKDGHPAYPVFWDFAFVIAGPTEGVVLVGSSSD